MSFQGVRLGMLRTISGRVRTVTGEVTTDGSVFVFCQVTLTLEFLELQEQIERLPGSIGIILIPGSQPESGRYKNTD